MRFRAGVWHARLGRVEPGAAFVVWGLRDGPALRAMAERLGVPVWRMEDGFLRSVGLGTDFEVPSSLVLDKRGIYFDPHEASDLEMTLERAEFTPAELARAAALRGVLIASTLSKYNLGLTGGITLPGDLRGRPVVLVPGQVEHDASIARGCVDVKDNTALLVAVRKARPDAYVIYKPHPDVLAGNREAGSLSLARAATLADQVVTSVPLHACLDVADEVHTMTSLVGFEALLRSKRVHCYGRPFYSGWGLTIDRHAVARRTRSLTLDMLTAGVLIRYPRYISQHTWAQVEPEDVVAELQSALTTAPARRRGLLRRSRMLRHALRGVFRDGP